MVETYRGGCYCGTVLWQATGKPILSAYCHCTVCQRLNACPFIHSIHFPASSFNWIHPQPIHDFLDYYTPTDTPWKKRWRCKNCGACVASYHEKNNRWSVWGAQLEKDEEGKTKSWEDLRPTVHMFYGTRLLDMNDDLPKWSGYENKSERLG